jgi:pimeloyl-ACP methyl ester carboxylesterase
VWLLFDLLNRNAQSAPAVPTPATVQQADFASQQPEWVGCYDTMQCAKVRAPLDWADPRGEQIELALVKQPALGGAPKGSLFVNPGGPGSSGVTYLASGVDGAASRTLQQEFDVISWDPRGVGQSSAVTCLDDAGMDKVLFGKSTTDDLEAGTQEWLDAALKENKAYGEACLEATGPLLGHIDTGSTVKDLDMLRAIVGDDKLNYLGYSYGTYIGARYADAYPERVGRLVLDGAIDPTSTEVEVVREQTRGFELALRAYMTDCLSRSECPVSGSVDEAMAQWRAMLDAVEANPLTGSDGRMVGSGTLLTAIITPLYSQVNWPYLDQLYATVTEGNADVALSLADFYYDRVDGVYQTNLITAFGAINCLDAPRSLPLNLEQMRADAAELERIAPTIGAFQGYGDVGCAAWPVEGVDSRPPVKAAGAGPILVVGTTGDPATPLRWAESLASQLESGVLLTYQGEGHIAYGNNACVNDTVDQYFLTGAVPAEGARCEA